MVRKEDRQATITRVSLTGIVVNTILVVFKAATGLASGSVSVINDAVNNAADSVSSIVTMAFYSIGKRRPTRKHPLGYGRMEYLSALIVSLLVLVTGVQCLRSAIEAIINPSVPDMSALGIAVIVVSILAKVFLSRISTTSGRRIDSQALVATGKDALSDVLVTSLTLISALLGPLTKLPVDGIAGVLVSLFILYAGISSILETASSIMGERPDAETVGKIRAVIAKHPPLKGGYDIILHSYGPERTLGTCNVEVPIDTHAEDIFDAMTDATHDIMKSMGIYLTFGMYAVNDYRSDVRQMKERALAVMKEASDSVLSLHAFHVHFDTRMVHFDVVVDFRVHNYAELKKQLEARLKEEWPDFDFEFWIDPDYA